MRKKYPNTTIVGWIKEVYASTNGVNREANRIQFFKYDAKNLSKIFRDSNRTTVAVLGGSKVSTKLNLINNLAKKI